MDRPVALPLTDNTQHSQQTSMPPAEFELAIPASDRPQTLALDRSATGIGILCFYFSFYVCFLVLYILFSILCVLCFCVLCFCVCIGSPHEYSCLFSICVQVY